MFSFADALANPGGVLTLAPFGSHSAAPANTNTAAQVAANNAKVAFTGPATQANVVNNNPILAGILGNQALIVMIGFAMLILIIWLAVTHKGL
jgi:hypothetical protein